LNIGSVSVVAPVYNEEDSVDPFCEAIFDVMQQLHLDYEVIMVDDGSTDRSFERPRAQADGGRHCRSCGATSQSAALMAGSITPRRR
jgi:glycosyltransferase involved in cell wall biosynthesis